MITVRFHAAAREAAGRSQTRVAADDTVGLREQLIAAHGPEMSRVLAVATLLVDGRPARTGERCALQPGTEVEVLPPFAGG